MRHRLLTLLCGLALVVGLAAPAGAGSLSEEARVNIRELQRITGTEFIVDVTSTSVAAEKGQVFLLAREFNTRKLQWFLVDLVARRVLRQGPCPFVGFSAMAVSPDAGRALVFTVFPVEVHELRLDTGAWACVHKNPKGAGLAVLGVSPLAWVGRSKACSLLDEHDAEQYALGGVIATLPPVEPLVTLRTLKRLAVKLLFPDGKRPPNVKAEVEEIRFGDAQSLLFVLKTLDEKTGRFVDHLLRFDAPDRVTLVETTEGELFPLDFDPRSGRVLYRRLERGRALPEVVLAEGDKKTTILTGKALVAGFLGTDLVGATTVNGASMQVFVGPRGKTLSRVITLNQPYSVVFLRDAPAFVLQSPTELRLYRVER